MLAAHQTDAVARVEHLLERRGGALLADDVGLGKSFVAAEVIRRFGGDAELIVPAALVAQWRETLAHFDAHARIFTHDSLVHEPFVPRPLRRLVVVDEAHAFRNPRTRRYAALAQRTIAARVLLVTATPVCNGADDLEALLRLIARDDLLADADVPSIDVAFETLDLDAIDAIVATLIVRRDRSVLPASLRFGELERRVVPHTPPTIPEIDALRFPLIGEHVLLRRFLRRRLESSEAALLESVRRQLHFYERALAAIAAGRTLPKRDYRRAFANEEDRDAFQAVLFWELFAPPGETDPREIRDEMQCLDAIASAARASPNEKRERLLTLLREMGEPALVFTGSAATARDLASALRCGLITSRVRSRDAVLDAFRRGGLDVIVSTDMAAEGLNLQRAGVVVHYDIPWNPVKLEQRNGRAHRIGQQRERVRAVYFLPTSRETGILGTMARKNRLRRRVIPCVDTGPPPPADRELPRGMTLGPRLSRDAAFHALRARVALPHALAKRHKAGIETLMKQMATEYLDQRRVEELLALVAAEV
ncbi:MAG TPA: helicase-related protein [Thermoanaerobaculia bacterium]|nr:helicase-related protein [Thermoanaerobaculia bacterium]